MYKPDAKGFSLVELMVVITIAAIIAAAALPNMRDFIRNSRLSSGVNDLLHSLNLARTEAIKRQNGNVVVCGSANPTVGNPSCDYNTFSGWFVFIDANNNWQHDNGEQVLEAHSPLDTSVTVKADPNNDIVSYAPTGFANLAGVRIPTSTLVFCDSRHVTAVGTTQSTARALFISRTGRARASALQLDIVNNALPNVGGALPVSATRHTQAGFTLVEAMVALVVLAVGMLGIAGLYVTTLKSGGGAMSRMQAVNLAADLADRIRVNRAANIAYLAASADNNCYQAGAAPAVCTPAQMAANDLLVWQSQVQAILPAGNGQVATVVPAPGSGTVFIYTILVSWRDSDGTTAQYTMTLQI